MGASRELLGAAHLVYYGLRGKDINSLLQPVPGFDNLKYLTEGKINSLGLNCLLYREAILLARGEYSTIYDDPRFYKENPDSGGVTLTGQQGIGMHL